MAKRTYMLAESTEDDTLMILPLNDDRLSPALGEFKALGTGTYDVASATFTAHAGQRYAVRQDRTVELA